MPDDYDDFSKITEPLKRSTAFGTCVLISVAGTAAIGSLVKPGLGTLAGAIVGGIYGWGSCSAVETELTDLLFDPQASMSVEQLRRLAQQVKRAYPDLTTDEVIARIAEERAAVIEAAKARA